MSAEGERRQQPCHAGAVAPMSLLDEWETDEDWRQLMIRALLYRLGPTGLFAARNRLMGGLVTHVERVRPVVDAVLNGATRDGG